MSGRLVDHNFILSLMILFFTTIFNRSKFYNIQQCRRDKYLHSLFTAVTLLVSIQDVYESQLPNSEI